MDFFKILDFIADCALREKVDAFIFAGDAYKTRDPSPTQQRGFGEQIKRIAKAGIPVVMVVGNHDTPNAEGKANTLDIYSALEIDNVWVSRKPEFLNIPTKSGNLQVLTAPWLHKEDFKSIGDKLLSMYEKINPKEPAVLVGHLEVAGAQMGSEKGLAIANEVTVPITLLTDRRLSYVALGHIHKYQELSSNPQVVYCGSPERIDFGEAKEEKGFVIVDIPQSPKSPQPTACQFIRTPARPFVAITIDLQADDSNPTATVIKEIGKHNLTDAIVRVIINIPAQCERELEMDKIKKALSGANFIAGISRNVERLQRQLLDGQEEVERLTPIEALQKYFESKNYPPAKMKELEKYATKILD